MLTRRVPPTCSLGLALAFAFALGCGGEPSDLNSGEPDDGCADDQACAQLGELVTRTFPSAPARRATGARHPVVLAHGFRGSSDNSWSFNGVADELRADGHFVHVANVPTIQGVEVRGAALRVEIDRARAAFCQDATRRGTRSMEVCLQETRSNVIAHSMGGLDARYVINDTPDGRWRVSTLTTISSPHLGTRAADLGLRLLPQGGTIADIADVAARAFARLIQAGPAGRDANLYAALTSLSERGAEEFNRRTPDGGGVYYQSWAGVSYFSLLSGGDAATQSSVAAVCHPDLRDPFDDPELDNLRDRGRRDRVHTELKPLYRVVGHGSEAWPNDGLVAVVSARWGRFRGCIPADHLNELGRPSFEHTGANVLTGFDHRAFYRRIANELAERGY